MRLVGQLSNPSAALGAVFKALPDEPIKAIACPELQFDVGRLGNGVVHSPYLVRSRGPETLFLPVGRLTLLIA
jgi:hypothetical protein